MSESFLNGRVTLHAGDMLDVLPTLPADSIDAVVCDPPYGISFMGKAWDHGVPSTLMWREVLRVLKPGGHLLAFAGTRTQHRMACAIEDAGFEIRDMIAWVYGSGFPKSLDVSKGIDKARNDSADGLRLGAWLKQQRIARGFKQKDVARLWPSVTGGLTGCVANWETLGKVPTLDQWTKLKEFIGFGDEMDAEVWRLNGRKGAPGEAWQTAEVVGRATDGAGNGSVVGLGSPAAMATEYDIKAANSEAARQWEGWGTALKPALEPITVARKRLNGTVAQNVLAHGNGALNIDGCRFSIAVDDLAAMEGQSGKSTDNNVLGSGIGGSRNATWSPTSSGRWPANLIHDGSDEVVAAFPSSKDGVAGKKSGVGEIAGGDLGGGYNQEWGGYGGLGSAARFFYSAKADGDDRLGSKHPTVKPLDLIQYLVRLVTPANGMVLDCFAGTGTTGEAAFREGMHAVLIEREPEYQADIRRRMTLCLAGPDERRRAIVKAKAKPDDLTGTLFAPAAPMAAE